VQEVVELGLRKTDGPAQASKTALKGVAEAFLKLFADFTPQADATDVRKFLEAVEDARAQIALSDHEQDVRRLAVSSVRACEQFLKQSRHYYRDRESELTDMIGILRETANLLAGDSTEFGAQMRATTDRFRGIAELEDIRDLKKQLTEEANLLQQTVADKLQRDQQAVSALTDRVQALEAHLVEAEEEASLDALTRIANRGRFDRSVTRMMKSARGAGTCLSLALIDIDHFKRINDEHGHTIGDRVLLCAAQWLTGAVRHSDLVARYGGEEFGVILADADLTAAETRFRAVVDQIASRSFEYDLDGKTRSIRFTVSCGVAQLTGQDTEADLIRRADEALYAAKRGGRNRVVVKKRSKLSGLFG
jgi:diguanylate cyclase (GGDEF)-like protein